ncbi:MAG: NAD(P)/FAD-dependent oxidoreductase [Chloroflexota bacterium]|nr:MAG: NAD(P)/FAD-dependent oxidoreductase [Chloroflexota bacterium]
MVDQELPGKRDIIVIGGGVNGLVAAAYLAKAGRKVLLVEKKAILGGIAVSEEFIPGNKFSSLVDGVGYLSPAISSDLKLSQHGLEIVPVDPIIYSLQPDGQNLLITNDVEATSEEIAKFSAADARAYPKFVELLGKISTVVAGIMHMTPPDLPEFGLKNLIPLRPLLKPVRNLGRKDFAQVLRVMPMPVADLLDEWFESEIVKGALAASALINISYGPQEAGTAFTLLYNWAGSNNGLFRSSGNIVGGMGALSQSLVNAAKALGVEIKTNSLVEKIIVSDGIASGIELDNGDKYSAKTIVSAVNITTTFLKLVDPYQMDQLFIKQLNNIKYRGTTARVHFVLTKLPSFQGANGNILNLLSGHLQISPTITYLQKAYDPVKYGRFSKDPYLDIFIPTITDPSLSSDGAQLMSVTVKYMPYHLRDDDWESSRDDLAELVVNKISEYAPGFEKLITQKKVLTPLDLERDYDLPEGNYTHGEMTLDQFMWMRPVPGYGQYRSPIKNLYLCSSATHPGGGVTGINGKNAAQEILKD